MSQRRNYSSKFKARVARAAIEGNATIAELSQQFEVHPNLVTKWKRKALDHLPDAFDTGQSRQAAQDEARVRELHAKIGELTVERDFCAKAFDR